MYDYVISYNDHNFGYSAYTVTNTRAEALAKLPAVQKSIKKDIDDYTQLIKQYPERSAYFKKSLNNLKIKLATLKVQTMNQYQRDNSGFYAGLPYKHITRKKFFEMLDILPPMMWKKGADFESFFCPEAWSGSFYRQYIRIDHNGLEYYFTKLIDIDDPKQYLQYHIKDLIKEIKQ